MLDEINQAANRLSHFPKLKLAVQSKVEAYKCLVDNGGFYFGTAQQSLKEKDAGLVSLHVDELVE